MSIAREKGSGMGKRGRNANTTCSDAVDYSGNGKRELCDRMRESEKA